MRRTTYYPIFADLRGRACVVAGGGLIAQRKALGLLASGAQVTIISPTLTKRLHALAREGSLAHRARRIRASDLSGMWLAIAATDDEAVNALVARTARQRRIFANVVDQPARCSFIAPAIVKRGRLTVAISTGGASPSVAKRLRQEVSGTIGAGYPRLLTLLSRLRAPAKRQLPSYRARRRYFDELIGGRVFQLVQQGRTSQARQEALRLLGTRTP